MPCTCLSTNSVDEIFVVIYRTICCGVWEVSVGDQLVDDAIRLARFFLYTLQPEKRWRRTLGIERTEQAGWDPGQFWACTRVEQIWS